MEAPTVRQATVSKSRTRPPSSPPSAASSPTATSAPSALACSEGGEAEWVRRERYAQ